MRYRVEDLEAPAGKELLAIAEALCGEEGLTAQASSFTRRDALRAWAERLPAGADVERIDQLADALLDAEGRVVALDFGQRLAARDVIRRGDGAVVPSERGERRYSTPQLLALERHGLDLVDRQLDAGIAVVDSAWSTRSWRGV